MMQFKENYKSFDREGITLLFPEIRTKECPLTACCNLKKLITELNKEEKLLLIHTLAKKPLMKYFSQVLVTFVTPLQHREGVFMKGTGTNYIFAS